MPTPGQAFIPRPLRQEVATCPVAAYPREVEDLQPTGTDTLKERVEAVEERVRLARSQVVRGQ